MGCKWSEVQILSPRPVDEQTTGFSVYTCLLASVCSSGLFLSCPRRLYHPRYCSMRILLSNDDGYFAPGLESLATALSAIADIVVVAPERDRSGASNSLT